MRELRDIDIDHLRTFEVTEVETYVPDPNHRIEVWDDGIADLPYLAKVDGIAYTPDEVNCIEVNTSQSTRTLGVVLKTGEEFFGFFGVEKPDELAEALASLRTLAGIAMRPRKCEGCDHCAFPGIRWPASPDEDRSKSWVERCDTCERFDSDEQAARYLSTFFDVGLCLDRVGLGDTRRWHIDRPERA